MGLISPSVMHFHNRSSARVLILVLLTLTGFWGNEKAVKVEGYKAVVLVHGMLDHSNSLDSLAERIVEKHPGTIVRTIDKFHGWHSITPLWLQIQVFRQQLEPIMKMHPEGIHLLGFSQGGLIARGLVQSCSDHNIRNFISLSSPQAGQYGDAFLRKVFPKAVKKTAWKLFYSNFGQRISIGNYWRDPHHIPLFLNKSTFLARVDNCVGTPNTTEFKDNFIKLKKLVLIGGPDDGVIEPWQSSQFSFYNKNETVVDMKRRLEYRRDLFGLKTLDKSNRVIRITVSGVKHTNWHRNNTVIDNYILPYLD